MAETPQSYKFRLAWRLKGIKDVEVDGVITSTLITAGESDKLYANHLLQANVGLTNPTMDTPESQTALFTEIQKQMRNVAIKTGEGQTGDALLEGMQPVYACKLIGDNITAPELYVVNPNAATATDVASTDDFIDWTDLTAVTSGALDIQSTYVVLVNTFETPTVTVEYNDALDSNNNLNTTPTEVTVDINSDTAAFTINNITVNEVTYMPAQINFVCEQNSTLPSGPQYVVYQYLDADGNFGRNPGVLDYPFRERTDIKINGTEVNKIINDDVVMGWIGSAVYPKYNAKITAVAYQDKTVPTTVLFNYLNEANNQQLFTATGSAEYLPHDIDTLKDNLFTRHTVSWNNESIDKIKDNVNKYSAYNIKDEFNANQRTVTLTYTIYPCFVNLLISSYFDKTPLVEPTTVTVDLTSNPTYESNKVFTSSINANENTYILRTVQVGAADALITKQPTDIILFKDIYTPDPISAQGNYLASWPILVKYYCNNILKTQDDALFYDVKYAEEEKPEPILIHTEPKEISLSLKGVENEATKKPYTVAEAIDFDLKRLCQSDSYLNTNGIEIQAVQHSTDSGSKFYTGTKVNIDPLFGGNKTSYVNNLVEIKLDGQSILNASVDDAINNKITEIQVKGDLILARSSVVDLSHRLFFRNDLTKPVNDPVVLQDQKMYFFYGTNYSLIDFAKLYNKDVVVKVDETLFTSNDWAITDVTTSVIDSDQIVYDDYNKFGADTAIQVDMVRKIELVTVDYDENYTISSLDENTQAAYNAFTLKVIPKDGKVTLPKDIYLSSILPQIKKGQIVLISPSVPTSLQNGYMEGELRYVDIKNEYNAKVDLYGPNTKGEVVPWDKGLDVNQSTGITCRYCTIGAAKPKTLHSILVSKEGLIKHSSASRYFLLAINGAGGGGGTGDAPAFGAYGGGGGGAGGYGLFKVTMPIGVDLEKVTIEVTGGAGGMHNMQTKEKVAGWTGTNGSNGGSTEVLIKNGDKVVLRFTAAGGGGGQGYCSAQSMYGNGGAGGDLPTCTIESTDWAATPCIRTKGVNGRGINDTGDQANLVPNYIDAYENLFFTKSSWLGTECYEIVNGPYDRKNGIDTTWSADSQDAATAVFDRDFTNQDLLAHAVEKGLNLFQMFPGGFGISNFRNDHRFGGAGAPSACSLPSYFLTTSGHYAWYWQWYDDYSRNIYYPDSHDKDNPKGWGKDYNNGNGDTDFCGVEDYDRKNKYKNKKPGPGAGGAGSCHKWVGHGDEWGYGHGRLGGDCIVAIFS